MTQNAGGITFRHSGKGENMVLWMMVSSDELELPIAVADTATELARMVGVNYNTIYSTISHTKTGQIKKTRYIRVEVDDE